MFLLEPSDEAVVSTEPSHHRRELATLASLRFSQRHRPQLKAAQNSTPVEEPWLFLQPANRVNQTNSDPGNRCFAAPRFLSPS
jgi:hypothetical protein